MTSEESNEEWPDMLVWVTSLQARYPNGIRLPSCWWRHADIVEMLAALRDHERGSFTPAAPATAAIEWQQARRFAEDQLAVWIKRLSCSEPGREHDPPTVDAEIPSGWLEFVDEDASRRRRPGVASRSDL